VRSQLQVCCCSSANWCKMKSFCTLRLNTSEWYDSVLWCNFCVSINVLRQDRNSDRDLTSFMNDKTDFLCSIVKSCDESMKDCDEN